MKICKTLFCQYLVYIHYLYLYFLYFSDYEFYRAVSNMNQSVLKMKMFKAIKEELNCV